MLMFLLKGFTVHIFIRRRKKDDKLTIRNSETLKSDKIES